MPGPTRYVGIPPQLTEYPALPVLPAFDILTGQGCPCYSPVTGQRVIVLLLRTVDTLLDRLDEIQALSTTVPVAK